MTVALLDKNEDSKPRMTFDEDTHAEPSYPSSRKQSDDHIAPMQKQAVSEIWWQLRS